MTRRATKTRSKGTITPRKKVNGVTVYDVQVSYIDAGGVKHRPSKGGHLSREAAEAWMLAKWDEMAILHPVPEPEIPEEAPEEEAPIPEPEGDEKATRADHGDGTILPRKLKSGKTVYDAWVSVLDPMTGKRARPAKRGLETRADAKRWIRKQQDEAEAGRRVLGKRGQLSFNECVQGWAETSPLKESTISDYLKTWREKGEGLIGDMKIGAIQQPDFDRMISSLYRVHTSASGLYRFIVVLQHAWDYGIASNSAAINHARKSPWASKVAKEMEAAKQEKKAVRQDQGYIPVLTPAQYISLIETERSASFRQLWQFYGLTGARRGEALGLKWKSVDLVNGIIWFRDNVIDIDNVLIHLSTPKGNKAKRIYVGDDVIELLAAQMALVEEAKEKWGEEWEENGLVFPIISKRSSNQFAAGHWQLPSLISSTYYRRAKRLEFSSTKLHGLRFTWATTAYRQGVDLKIIQEHMGHKFDMTTLNYIENSADEKRAASNTIARALRGE